MKNTKKTGQKGFILLFSLTIVGLISFIAVSFFTVVVNDLRMSYRMADSIRAYYAAEAGLAEGFLALKAAGVNPNLGALAVSDTNYPVGTNLTGSYSVQFSSNGEAVLPVYTLISTGTFHNVTRRLSLKVRAATYAAWSYLSNTEIHPVYGGSYWCTGQTVYGNFHTNGQLNIYGAPIFDGPVSTVSPTINYWNGTEVNAPVFSQGITLGAQTVSFPAAAQFVNSLDTVAQSGGLRLTGNSTITLLSDGTMNVTNAAAGWTNHNMAMPGNNALYIKDGNATVSGVLNGQLTIGTNRSIYIPDNIVYNTDPRVDPASTDMLGLVALGDVNVTDYAPFDVEIDGYVVAVNGALNAMNCWNYKKGDLVQFGGLMNNYCGVIGFFDNSGWILGYNQLPILDERLNETSPPWFPPAQDAYGKVIYRKVQFSEL